MSGFASSRFFPAEGTRGDKIEGAANYNAAAKRDAINSGRGRRRILADLYLRVGLYPL